MKCACGKQKELPASLCWDCEKRLCNDCKRYVFRGDDSGSTAVCKKCANKYIKNS